MERKKNGKNIVAITLAVIFSVCAIAFLFAETSFRLAHKWKQWKPTYEKQDISALILQEELSSEEYELLYAQTGLTKIGIDGLRQMHDYGKILNIQAAYFAKQRVWKDNFAPYTCIESIDEQIPNAALRAGDIVVSDTTHVMGFRLGHAALVLDSKGSTLEAFSIGTDSEVAHISAFTTTASFIILRPKNEETARRAAAYAKEDLEGIPYSFFRGILNKKNPKKLKDTQCAHIVWYAYKQCGLDLDSDGGGLVTPQDLANSEHLEVVQVYGFHPQKLWK